MPISSADPMFDHLLESSRRDDSNKKASIGFGREKIKAEPIELNFTLLSGTLLTCCCYRPQSSYAGLT